MIQTPLDSPYDIQYVTVGTAERHWVERSRKNVADFVAYLSDGEMRPPAHHLEWMYYILGYPSSRVNIIAPRGSGKTTALVYIFAWLIGKKPWLTNAIFSVSAEQAEARLREIRSIITDNPRYHNVFPWIELDIKKPNNQRNFTVWSKRWKGSDSEIDYPTYRSMISRYGEPLNSTLFSAGIGSSGIVGKRFTGLVLLDDPHDARNSATEEQRIKVEEVLKETIIGCCKPEARLCVISTRWAETDLAGRLEEQKKRDGSRVWTTMQTKAILDDGTSYWPQEWPLDVLEAKREDVGDTIFELMFMNNPLGLSSGEFTLDMLRKSLPDPLPELREVLISCDLSRTTELYSDYTVFAAVGRDKLDPFNYYVLDMVRGQFGGMEPSLNKLAEFSDKTFRAHGQLKAILFSNRGFDPVWAESFKEKHLDMPVKIVPEKGEKGDRLKAVAIKAQQNRMFINTLMAPYNALCSELIGFPGRHDDICDALSLPFQHWGWAGFQRAGTKQIKSPFLL